jgi:hypothetical protein
VLPLRRQRSIVKKSLLKIIPVPAPLRDFNKASIDVTLLGIYYHCGDRKILLRKSPSISILEVVDNLY